MSGSEYSKIIVCLDPEIRLTGEISQVNGNLGIPRDWEEDCQNPSGIPTDFNDDNQHYHTNRIYISRFREFFERIGRRLFEFYWS